MLPHLVYQHFLLARVDPFHRGEDLRLVTHFLRGADERLHVLGEARPTIAGARINEGIADAGIRADTHADLLDVRPEPLGDERQLVHEADLGGQHRIGRVLGQLGGADIHDNQPIVVADERLI